ncbi:50S ribosomal protein L31 [bacterium]|nr:50S ribosomal protein L31 [bacterium]
MKKGIHPKLHKVTVTCSCGETYETISTRESLKVEICSKCHPYFTGKKKIIDKGGRVDRFKRRYAKASGAYKFTEEGAETEKTEETKSEE